MFLKFPGQRPKTLGVHDGRLAECPNKPNCVCSVSPGTVPDDANPHHVHPLTYEGDAGKAWQRLIKVLEAEHNAQIISRSGSYVHAEFTSTGLGFVDDVEFHLRESEQRIHVRSASRLGYSDWGVNRQRVERLREAFDDAL